MLNFPPTAQRRLLERRHVAALCAGMLTLVVTTPPGFAADGKEAPAASPETPAPSQNPQPTNKESPPDDQQSPATGQAPAQQESSPTSGPPSGAGAPAATASSSPVEKAAGKSPSQSPEAHRLHRVQMRLSGSTCLSCLMALERKLKELPGIAKAKIERADQTHFEFQGAPGSTYSEATITYDIGQVALSDIIDFMRNHGYRAYKIVDKQKG